MPYTNAYEYVTKFYSNKSVHHPSASQEARSGALDPPPVYDSIMKFILLTGKLTADVTSFPQQVVIALAHVVKYLSAFDVADALLETQFFTKFTERSHMLLNGNTLTNL